MKTFTIRAVTNLSKELIDKMNGFINRHNSLANTMNKVIEMDVDEFSPEKAVGLMTSLFRQSMNLQIFINTLDNYENVRVGNMTEIAISMLNSVDRMIADLQEKFNAATGFEYADDEDDEDDENDEGDDGFPSEDAYCAKVIKTMNDVISCDVQEIDSFCAADKFDIGQAVSLLTEARQDMSLLNRTIESAEEEDHEDVVKAAVENKAKLKAHIKKLKLLIEENAEK